MAFKIKLKKKTFKTKRQESSLILALSLAMTFIDPVI